MSLYVIPRVVNSRRIVGTKPQYTSRLRSLCRMNKLGIYLGPEKQDALYRGDTSNTVVNRYFVYGFRATGTHLCEALDGSPATVRLLARFIQKAWEALVDIYRGNDQRLAAQGLLVFLHSLIVMGIPSRVWFYFQKVCELIDSGNLRFLPVYGRPPELSDQVREDAAVLSQAIYLENYLYLALGGPAPVKTAKLAREFRQDLQVRIICCRDQSELSDLAQGVYPTLFNLCPLTMRTQSILLVRDVTQVLVSHPADRKANLNVSL